MKKNFWIGVLLLIANTIQAQSRNAKNWGGYQDSISVLFSHKEYASLPGLLEKSQDWFKQNQLTQHIEFANLLAIGGEVYLETVDLKKAKEYYEKAIQIYKQSSSPNQFIEEKVYLGMRLALVYAQLGHYQEAENLLKNVEARYQQMLKEERSKNRFSDSVFFISRIEKTFGDLHFTKNEMALAEKRYQKAIDMVGKQKTNVPTEYNNYAEIYIALGDLYELQGLQEKALGCYQNAQIIYENLLGAQVAHKFVGYTQALIKIATCYIKKRDFENAEPPLAQALDIQKKISEESVLYADATMALARYSLYKDVNHPERALKVAKVAYLLYKKNFFKHSHTKLLEAANLVGFIALFAKDYKTAYDYFQKALKEAEGILADPNHIYLLHLNYNLALTKFYQKEYNDAYFYFQKGHWVMIEQIYRNFQHLTEKEKDALYKTFDENILLFAYFAQTIYPQTKVVAETLLNLILYTKAFLFNQNRSFLKSITGLKNENIKKSYQQWLALKAELAHKQQSTNLNERQYYNSGKSLLEKQIEEIEKELAQNIAEFKDKSKKPDYHWLDLQKMLKNDEAIVEMVRTYSFQKGFHQDSAIYIALIVRPNFSLPEMVILPNGYAMEKEDINFYRNCIRVRKKDENSFNIFWNSIAEKLKGCKKVYFSPDGIYHQINIATLYNPTTQKYVFDEVDIHLISSARDLLEMKKNKQLRQNYQNYRLYLFGYPDYANHKDKLQQTPTNPTQEIDRSFQQQRFFDLEEGTILSLPGTKKEVESIFNFALKNQVFVQKFMELEASEDNLKKIKNPDILHIATHGFFIEEKEKLSPLQRSGLLLAGSELALQKKLPNNVENGILTAQEVLSLDLQETALVVLSACETGLGEIRNGEGVFGLQRAFQEAGAKSVLMSLWKVDDQATQEMMSLFYENLLLKKLPKRTAFTLAQKNLKEKYKHPYYWAAFVMVGE